ncbi:MAG: hypothetical protein ACEQSA_01285 [Weeksellaceae bacterium]
MAKQIDNKWFYTNLSPVFKVFLIFVKGDIIFLLPAVLVILAVGFFSLKWMSILLSLYYSVRFAGEVMYWFLQQFGSRSYRPYDFGFTKIDNNAVYILYQTFTSMGLVASLGILIYLLLTL